jgi:hypothetical protein
MSGAGIFFGDCRYKVPDLSAARLFYSTCFRVKTYFDEPEWVIFQIHKYQLWLEPQNLTEESVYESTNSWYDPSKDTRLTSWIVDDVQEICKRFKELGGSIFKKPKKDGPFIHAIVKDPWGNTLGLHSNSF